MSKNRGASHGTEKQEVFEKFIMINRIRSNIQTNYTFCDILRKPTAKQIAFLEEIIMSPAIEDKDQENRTTAIDLFARWYRQNNAMRET